MFGPIGRGPVAIPGTPHLADPPLTFMPSRASICNSSTSARAAVPVVFREGVHDSADEQGALAAMSGYSMTLSMLT